jgi:dsRNA-specific ribonuclease
VEALIGAAYEHGGFNLGYECAKFFDLGVKWQPLTSRLAHVQANIPPDTSIGIKIPAQIADVESMIGYTFKHKILLIEALTHASYGDNAATISYERLEFLGDSILDMIVTDYLYHAPGKTYSPGHMHIRKSAVVNGHFLAYICLGLKHTSRAVMPQPVTTDEDGELPRNPYARKIEFEQGVDEQEIYLWQCLLHSNQGVLEDQTNTFTRYEKWREVIQHALENETVFPWAALTRLQAPKFFSDIVEAVIGAVFLDCGGNMGTIKDFLRGIGILPVLERIVADDVDVLHPVSRVAMWASRNDKTVEFEFEHERGDISCVILVDGEEEVRETEKFRGKTSQEEVKYAVAEKAIKQFKLRDTGAKTGIGDKWKRANSRPKRKRRSEE